jgi:hypothetical protein
MDALRIARLRRLLGLSAAQAALLASLAYGDANG